MERHARLWLRLVIASETSSLNRSSQKYKKLLTGLFCCSKNNSLTVPYLGPEIVMFGVISHECMKMKVDW